MEKFLRNLMCGFVLAVTPTDTNAPRYLSLHDDWNIQGLNPPHPACSCCSGKRVCVTAQVPQAERRSQSQRASSGTWGTHFPTFPEPAIDLFLTAHSSSDSFQSSPQRHSPTHNKGQIVGSFDIATVEDLALFFATESVRRFKLPLAFALFNRGKNRWNKQEDIDEILKNPPKADANGVVYPFGDKNPLSFVFDPETRTMTCWERLIKKRGSVGMLALTGPEMAAALNARSSRKKDRGGADFAYDPIRDALSLRRSYVNPPSDRERFYKEIDTLVKTLVKWEKGKYLKHALAIVDGLQPPDSATAATHGFSATLLLRHFSVASSESAHWAERYLRTWDRPHGGMTPNLVSNHTLLINQLFHAYIHFRGAKNDAHRKCDIDATFRLVGPNDATVFSDLKVPIWRSEAPPVDHLQIGINDISIALDDEYPVGPYRLEVEVCEVTTQRCVTLEHAFVLQSQ